MRPRLRPRTGAALVACVLAVSAAAAFQSDAGARASAACDRYAAPSGRDHGAGTKEDPFRTADKLVRSLAPGQTGCLAGRMFEEDLTVRRGGEPGAPITLTSTPGDRVTLKGRLWIADSANDVVISNLRLDGRNSDVLPSPSVNGDRVTFVGNDVTNHHTAICFVIGSTARWGLAYDTAILSNRIHDCGKLPANNHEHGIYVEGSRNARIVGNYIYDNADRGMQLYPDAQNTVIEANVLDGNGTGVLFSGAEGRASSHNRVVGNVISNANLRYNIESWYPAGNPIGRDNLAERNCIWNGVRGDIAREWGFRAEENLFTDPEFVNRDRKDFRMRSRGACARLMRNVAGTDSLELLAAVSR